MFIPNKTGVVDVTSATTVPSGVMMTFDFPLSKRKGPRKKVQSYRIEIINK